MKTIFSIHERGAFNSRKVQLFKSLFRLKGEKTMKAIALLEVQAMVAAIAGLDAMVKAADVKLIHVEKRLGGRLVTVVVEGEVSAVQAALEAGAAAAKEVGNVKVCEVIARPHPDVMRFLTTG